MQTNSCFGLLSDCTEGRTPFSTHSTAMGLLVMDATLQGSAFVGHSKLQDQPDLPVLQVHDHPGYQGSSWFHEELKSRGLQFTEVTVYESFEVEEEEKRKAKKDAIKAQQEEKKENKLLNNNNNTNNNNNLNSHNDISEAVALVASLKVCAKQKDLQKGSILHAEIVKRALLETNIFVGTILVSLYAKCGALEKAQEVFEELPHKNVVSWNALIGGFAQCGCGEYALRCYDQMLLEGFSPDAVTFICILNACGSIGDAEKGEEVHAQIGEKLLLEHNVALANALVDMYAKCGSLAKAQEVFDELQVRDTISWNGLIAGYAQHGYGKEALSCYNRMLFEGFPPNDVTFISLLKACASIEAVDLGQEVHSHVIKAGLMEENIVTAYSLLDMYAKCGSFSKVQEVFVELPVRNVAAWNKLISACVQHEHWEKALNFFDHMQLEGFSSDAITFACTLKACGSRKVANKGQSIHAQIIKSGLLEDDVMIGTALVDMYAKCGLLAKSQGVFDEIPIRDAVTWNSLIAGYAQHDNGEEALVCFTQMLSEGFSPSPVTFTCILKACGIVGAACNGQSIHSEIVRLGLVESNHFVDTGLVDMYASCGMLAEAQEVFDKFSSRGVVSWSALMVGYAQLGEDKIVFDLFNKMIAEGTQPDPITYSIVLSTCSHRGLLEEGQAYLEMVTRSYGVIPTLEHYTCMADLFGRAGHFEEVVALVQEIPFSANLMLWQTLLGAFQKWERTKLGRWAFEHAVVVNNEDPGSYVSMCNMYAATRNKFLFDG